MLLRASPTPLRRTLKKTLTRCINMEAIGRSILQYRHTIRQNLPFQLKRLHVWNVSGWTPSQASNDPKLRLTERLLRTGPVSLQKLDGVRRLRKHCITLSLDCRLHILQASQQTGEGFLEVQQSSSLLAGAWTGRRKLSQDEQFSP